MNLTKDIYKSDVILNMLDIALTILIENDICEHCLNGYDKDILICNNLDLCKSNLFEGIAKTVIKGESGNVKVG